MSLRINGEGLDPTPIHVFGLVLDSKMSSFLVRGNEELVNRLQETIKCRFSPQVVPEFDRVRRAMVIDLTPAREGTENRFWLDVIELVMSEQFSRLEIYTDMQTAEDSPKTIAE